MQQKSPVNKGPNCEIEIGRGKRKIFIKVFFDPVEIWISLSSLPPEAFLCAMMDGVSMFQSDCGARKPFKTCTFVNIEWAIHEWGGYPELVEALKVRKEIILKDVPRLKKLYGNKEINV